MERAFCTNRLVIINSMNYFMEKNAAAPKVISKKRIQTYARLLNNAGGTATLNSVATSSSDRIFRRCFD